MFRCDKLKAQCYLIFWGDDVKSFLSCRSAGKSCFMGVPGLMEELLEKLQSPGVCFFFCTQPGWICWIVSPKQSYSTSYVLEHPGVTVLLPNPGLMTLAPAHLFLITEHPGAISWDGRFVELVPQGPTEGPTDLHPSLQIWPLCWEFPNSLKMCDIS